jgi:hypothetical protein
MRKSTLCLGFTAIGGILLLFLLFVYPRLTTPFHEYRLNASRQLVRKLHLTDLCLFTEARYTRHLSQADLHSAFQDHPLSFEHFPSGSLTLPPALIQRKGLEKQ